MADLCSTSVSNQSVLVLYSSAPLRINGVIIIFHQIQLWLTTLYITIYIFTYLIFYLLSSASVLSRLILPCRYQLTWIDADKRPLNRCCCCCNYLVTVSVAHEHAATEPSSQDWLSWRPLARRPAASKYCERHWALEPAASDTATPTPCLTGTARPPTCTSSTRSTYLHTSSSSSFTITTTISSSSSSSSSHLILF